MVLDLSDTAITDAGLDVMADCDRFPNLSWLILKNTRTTAARTRKLLAEYHSRGRLYLQIDR